ncbi:hypothetical protein AAHC03_09184 [Spirometra sp. Aus1]
MPSTGPESTTQSGVASATTEQNSSYETTSELESTKEIEDNFSEGGHYDMTDHIDLGAEEWWDKVQLDDDVYLQCSATFGNKNSTRVDTPSITPEIYGIDEVNFSGPQWNTEVKDDEDFDSVCEKEEEQVTDEVDFNSPEWSKKVDLKDVFSTICERTTNATTTSYLNTTASETDEDEQVTDEVDFNSPEWSKKVDLEDIFNTVCERTFIPPEHVTKSAIISLVLNSRS